MLTREQSEAIVALIDNKTTSMTVLDKEDRRTMSILDGARKGLTRMLRAAPQAPELGAAA
jgi:hypothetical protein